MKAEIESFQQTLLGAWRAAECNAVVHPDGSITFYCPQCVAPIALDVEDGMAACPDCSWGAEGEPWAIAEAGKAVTGNPVTEKKDTELPLLGLDEILSYQPDASEEIWPGGILSAGAPTAVIGAPGVGKSRIVLQAAIRTLTGRPFLGWETRGVGLKWLFLQTENATRRLHMDLAAMTRGMSNTDLGMIREGLRILNIMEMDFATISMTDGHPDRARILRTLEKWQPDIVEIDPLRDAGTGDPNKDADMTEICKGIASTVRQSNPRRATLVVHHGRTGSVEASKVFGNDAGSFARNSKVLYGWLRSQINIAAAGIEWPGTIIVGCGKCSDGAPWEPFAARLDTQTMSYRRLDESEFDLEEWEGKMGAASSRRKRRIPSPEEVASVVSDAGGEMSGAVNAPDGLIAALKRKFGTPREDSKTAIEAAEGVTIERREDSNDPSSAQRGGGKPKRIYALRPGRKYEK